MIKTTTKRSKTMKVVGKMVDKIQKLILATIKKSGRKNYFHWETNSACYKAVSYFSKHKPIIGKVYVAKIVLGNYDRTIPFLRRNVRKMLELIHGMKLVAVKTIPNFPNKFVSFKFAKK